MLVAIRYIGIAMRFLAHCLALIKDASPVDLAVTHVFLHAAEVLAEAVECRVAAFDIN
ncbi:hypothetical protein [Nitrosospira sp. Nsp11]|uniref:hypothetical protein n=1 Tax=Nitrosospira sp. Nsp11 TaxID=1855338 RepID=UPI0015B749A5|nr:hypothetical protein [Nitrosospira sp. Nsp11]